MAYSAGRNNLSKDRNDKMPSHENKQKDKIQDRA
jgi:hypothetical protein